MIIDIIPMPPKIQNETIDMSTQLWDSRNYPTEDERYATLGRVLANGLQHLTRYKIIEAYGTTIAEHVFLCEDAMDERSMWFESAPGVSITCFPITTRLHDFAREQRHQSFRYLSGINQVMQKINPDRTPSQLMSIHQLVLKSIYESSRDRRDFQLQNIAHEYASKNDSELRSIFSASDDECDRLVQNLNYLVSESHNISNLTPYANEEPEGMLHELVRVPRAPPNSSLVNLMMRNGMIESEFLRRLRGTAFPARKYCHTMEDTSAFVLDSSTIFNIHDDAKWMWVPLLNLIENIPYTDFAMSYSGGVCRIDHAFSIFGRIEYPSLERKFDDIAAQLRVAVRLLYLNIDSLNFRATITRTFAEDVYLEIFCDTTHKRFRFYFDLTIAALGSRGIIDANSSMAVNQFVQPRASW